MPRDGEEEEEEEEGEEGGEEQRMEDTSMMGWIPSSSYAGAEEVAVEAVARERHPVVQSERGRARGATESRSSGSIREQMMGALLRGDIMASPSRPKPIFDHKTLGSAILIDGGV